MTYRLKPGQSWDEAEITPKQTERYVLLEDERFLPVGALVAKELVEEGAELAVFLEMWGGTVVAVNHELMCVPIEGRLAEVIAEIKATNENKLGGFPDVLGIFPDGRLAFREIKNANTRDKLGKKQHDLTNLLFDLYGDKFDLKIVEWGRRLRGSEKIFSDDLHMCHYK